MDAAGFGLRLASERHPALRWVCPGTTGPRPSFGCGNTRKRGFLSCIVVIQTPLQWFEGHGSPACGASIARLCELSNSRLFQPNKQSGPAP